jgi:hypothetical protein
MQDFAGALYRTMLAGDTQGLQRLAEANYGTLVGSTAFVFAGLLAARWARAKGGRRRAMSFNSKCMLKSFPEEAKVWPPIVNICLFFDTCPSAETLAVEIKKKLHPYDRFRQGLDPDEKEFFELSEEKQSVEWIVSNAIKSHVVADEQSLMSTLDGIVAKDIDYKNRPLWEVHRIVNKGKGCSGVLFRIHHVIGDGIALITSFGNFFEDKHGNPTGTSIAESMSGGSSPRAGSKTPPASPTGKKREKDKGPGLIARVLDFVTSFFSVLGLAVSAYDSNLAFFGSAQRATLSMSSRRKTVIFPTLRLSFVKALKDAAQATVNDVLLSATSGAIKRYCDKKGDTEPAPRGRALVPVAFPRARELLEDPSRAMQNLWAFASIPMPLAQDDVLSRLRATSSATQRLKQSSVVLVQLLVQTYILPLLPGFLQRKTAHDVFSRHTVVFSNLPGPSDVLYFCKERLLGLQVVFPNLLPQVLLLSYGGQVFFSMSVDADVVDADLLTACYVEEMRAMADALGVKWEDNIVFSKKSDGGVLAVVDSE